MAAYPLLMADRKGRSAFEQLQNHFDDTDMQCPQCGYVDDKGEWISNTDGSEVRYQHICSNCGNVRMRSVTISE